MTRHCHRAGSPENQRGLRNTLFLREPVWQFFPNYKVARNKRRIHTTQTLKVVRLATLTEKELERVANGGEGWKVIEH